MEQIKLEATNEQTPPERLKELARINSTIASLVASNPNASPELLTELANSEENFIRKNVAANPNTPTGVLWKLGEKFPEEVLDNAVFPLLLLENPNLVKEIPRRTAVSFLSCSNVPIAFMEWAARSYWSWDTKLYMTTKSQTPRSLLEILVRGNNSIVAKAAQLHVNYAGELEDNWQVAFNDELDRSKKISADRYCFEILAAIGLVPELFLKSLPRHERTEVPCKKLRQDSSFDFEKISPAELLQNSKKLDTRLFLIHREAKIALAANPNTPVEILEKLECEQDLVIPYRLASNPNTPKHILEKLAYSNSSWTRKAVASNPKVPQHLIDLLAKDKEPKVRRALATHPKAPFSILEECLSELLVYKKADANILLRYLRKKPEGLPTLLELIFNKSSELTRTIALWHPQMPTKVLAKNEQSLVWLERCAIAQNPNTPIETLQLLAADGNRIVRAAAKENLNRMLNT